MKNKVGVLALVVFLGISVVTITKTIESKVNQKKENEKITIGFSMDSFVIERWQRDKDFFMMKAKELGAEVIVLCANEENETQIKQIKYLIDQNVDALVIIPYDKDGLTDVIKQAKRKGIKVICYDRLVQNSNVDLYVSFDNVNIGEEMGKALLQNIPNGNYIIINGSPKDLNSNMFNSGYYKGLDKSLKSGDVKIVKEVWADDWREDVAYNTIIDAINDGIEFDAVILGNDRLAEAAIQALSEKRIAENVYVAGSDADLSACQRIVEGTQLMTIYKPIKNLAEGAAELAIELVMGKDIGEVDYINDGTYNIPYIKFEVIPVNKDSMVDTVIKDGFHKLEDVYRNIPKGEWPVISH